MGFGFWILDIKFLSTIIILLASFCAVNSAGLDISYPRETIPVNNEWRYGFNLASKRIGERQHLALYVDERFACKPAEVYLVGFDIEDKNRLIEAKKVDGAFIADFVAHSTTEPILAVICQSTKGSQFNEEYRLAVPLT